jgi:hypothetical protein
MFQGMEWATGSVSVLLILSAGLTLLAQQTLGKDNSEVSAAALLLALYLGSWLFVLGIVGLVLLSVWWLVGWQHVRATRAAVSRYSPAELMRRHLEKPEQEDSLSFRQSVVPVVPSRSPKGSVDENEPNSLTKVA